MHEGNNEEGTASSSGPPKMSFRLLGRDSKGRVETRQLMVPTENKIAVKLKQKGEKERLEKELLKEKTLLCDTLADSEPQTVAYLGNKDHFVRGDINSRAPTQRNLDSASQSWKGSGNTSKEKELAGSSYSLDLDGFLAVAHSEETTKFRGAVRENSASTRKGGK